MQYTKSAERTFGTATSRDVYETGISLCPTRFDHAANVKQLRKKITTLEALNDRMRMFNCLVRNRNAKELVALGYTDAQIQRLLDPVCGKNVFVFPDRKVQCGFIKIRALKSQLKELEEIAERRNVEIVGGGYIYAEDVPASKIWFRFPAKQGRAVRAELRKHGFILEPGPGIYSRSLCGAGLRAGQLMRDYLDGCAG